MKITQYSGVLRRGQTTASLKGWGTTTSHREALITTRIHLHVTFWETFTSQEGHESKTPVLALIFSRILSSFSGATVTEQQ